ncbi:unnamed protein product [Alopecurus aequalis]
MATPTVVLLPLWPAGHLLSMIDLGKRLLAHSDGALSLTVLVMQAPTESDRSEMAGHIRREEASGLDIRSHVLPAVEPPTDYVGAEEFVSRFIELNAEHVKAAISDLTCPVAAVVLDFFGTMLLDVCRELSVPAYVYITTDAAFYALLLLLPALHEEVAVEFEEMDGLVSVPGLPPVPPTCLPVGMMDRKNPNYTWFMYHGRRFPEADGVIINTAAELEQSVLAAIADDNGPTLYPVGPMLSFPRPVEQPHPCLQWLDAQPPASVVLLCFGSAGYFTTAQAHEVADGLERSGHRFLWVLRGAPAPDTPYIPTDADLGELLPEGFLERTKEKGLVWPTKAPQKEILAHGAVRGFVTHCGWNSTLESLWFGVPMVPWPLYAEQHFNAFTLVASMGVAVAIEVDRKRNNFVQASELERAVKVLMDTGSDDGRKARAKATEMKAVCRKAVHEEGGSSYAALCRLTEHILRKCAVCTTQ